MKCRRAWAANANIRDFIVVDDITGVKKLRSECAVDGYGFLSAHGDPRHPQEFPAIINEQMAAWPDARPVGNPVYLPQPNYVYFIYVVEVLSVSAGISTTFNGADSVGLNGRVVSIDWYLDGEYVGTGFQFTIPMDGGPHTIRIHLTDEYGNQGDHSFDYTQPVVAIALESGLGFFALESGGVIEVE